MGHQEGNIQDHSDRCANGFQAGVLVDAKQAEGAVPGAARRAGADGASERVTVEQLWVKYAARLTGIVVRYLRADYWHMPQASSSIRRPLSQGNTRQSGLYMHTAVSCVYIPIYYTRQNPPSTDLCDINQTSCELSYWCTLCEGISGTEWCMRAAGEGASSREHLRQRQEAHGALSDGQGPHL